MTLRCAWFSSSPWLALAWMGLVSCADPAVERQDSAPKMEVTRVQPDENGSIRLEVGKTLEATLAGGERHRFALPPGRETTLRIVADQRGVDVILELVDGAGSVLASADSPNQRNGIERLETDVATDSSLELQVRTWEQDAAAGTYRVTLDQWQPSTPETSERSARIEAEREAFERCYELVMQPQGGSAQTAYDLCQQVVRLAAAARDDHGLAWAQFALGELLTGQGKFDLAREHLDRAKAGWRDDRYAAERALLLAQEGIIDRKQGDLDAGIASCEERIAFWHERGDGILEGVARNDLGMMQKDRGDLPAALTSFRQAVALIEPAEDPAIRAAPLVNQGVTEFELGNYRAALALYARVHELLDAHEAIGTQHLVDALIGEGTVYTRIGEPWRMLDRFERAWPLLEQLDDPARMATLLQNQASAFLTLGDQRAALDSYRRALALFRQVGDRGREAFTLCNLGSLNAAQGDGQTAMARFEEALAIGRELADVQVISLALVGRGSLYRDRNDPKAALKDLGEALRIREDSAAALLQAATLNEIGQVHLLAGSSAAARKAWEQALRLNEGQDWILEAASRFGLVRVLRDAGELDRALEQMERVNQIDEELRGGVTIADTRDSLLASRRVRFEAFIDLLLRMDAERGGAVYAARAFQVSEQARARGLSELLAEAKVEVRGSLSPQLLEEERRLALAIAGARNQLALGVQSDDSPAIEARQLRLASLRDERRRLESRIRLESPRYAQLSYPKPVTLAETQGLLGPDTVMLEYVVGEQTCVLFVITHDRFEVVQLTISPSEVRRAVAELRTSLEGTGRFATREYGRVAYRLYQGLVAPVSALLEGARRLIVVPDRDLFYIPFEALLTEEPEPGAESQARWPYLIKKLEVAYGPSATVLADLRCGRSRRDRRWVAFADPEYGGALPRLEASGAEARGIGALFDPGAATIYSRAAASERNLKTSPFLARARWIHFATHGTIDEAETAAIRLELSTPSAEDAADGEDGRLYLREVFDLDLDAEVVVLSACQTALGREVTGEGLIGLSRGFFYAGACSVVVSQWRVDDERTANLMVRFYRSLLASEDPISALRQAKLEMIETVPGGSHPHYWAPFILTGNPARKVL